MKDQAWSKLNKQNASSKDQSKETSQKVLVSHPAGSDMRGIVSDHQLSVLNVQNLPEEAKLEKSMTEPMVPEREFENLKSLTF